MNRLVLDLRDTGVSACRGAGGQWNADRDTGTERSASVGAWLDCLESTGIKDSYGVVKSKWAAPNITVGQEQGIWHLYACQEDGYPMRVEQFSDSDAS